MVPRSPPQNIAKGQGIMSAGRTLINLMVESYGTVSSSVNDGACHEDVQLCWMYDTGLCWAISRDYWGLILQWPYTYITDAWILEGEIFLKQDPIVYLSLTRPVSWKAPKAQNSNFIGLFSSRRMFVARGFDLLQQNKYPHVALVAQFYRILTMPVQDERWFIMVFSFFRWSH